ncbi:MAG: bacterial Ig-like domain-containing protein, partial [Lachnospiraceae bacterium]|nr:bacterial Ig-like domain-containing protein [Lachnospiraceae bacterium]
APTTAAPTEPETTAAPTTAAPTEPETTAVPTTAAPTEPETTAVPTTAAPTEPETTAAPTTAAPTEPETTVAPTIQELRVEPISDPMIIYVTVNMCDYNNIIFPPYEEMFKVSAVMSSGEIISLSNDDVEYSSSGFDIPGLFHMWVTYQGFNQKADVPVNFEFVEDEITSVKVFSNGQASLYWYGDTFHKEGMYLEVEYAHSETEMVTGYDCPEDNMVLNMLGEKTIHLSVKDKTVSYTVQVIEGGIDYMEILQLPYKTSYLFGEILDYTGLVIKLHYANGAERIVEDLSNIGFRRSYTDKNYAIQNPETILFYYDNNGTYCGELSFEFEVKNDPIVSLTITNMPNKTTFYVGDYFDSTGLEVSATLASGNVISDTVFYCNFVRFDYSGTIPIDIFVYDMDGVAKSITLEVNAVEQTP